MEPTYRANIGSYAKFKCRATACMQLTHAPCFGQLQYAAKRGFYFSTPKPGMGAGEKEVPPLPRDFIQVDSLRSRTSVTCTTHKLNALNARLSDAATDCLVLTEQVSLPHNACRRNLLLTLPCYACQFLKAEGSSTSCAP